MTVSIILVVCALLGGPAEGWRAGAGAAPRRAVAQRATTSREVAAPPPSAAAVPRHVAIVPDGNGRWATRRGLPRAAGHEAGARRALALVRRAADRGVGCLTLFVLSTENWARPRAEVSREPRRAPALSLADGAERLPPSSSSSLVRAGRRADRVNGVPSV